VRKLLTGAALAALLAILIASPALAATTKQAVSANEYRIGQSLIAAGLVAPFATPAQIDAAVRAFAQRAQPSVRELKLPQVARTLAGKRSTLGSFLSTRTVSTRATQTYTSKTLVLLVEFGDDPWPSGDQAGHNVAGPLAGSVPPPAADDNATFWPGDFSRGHFQDMLFGNSFSIYDSAGVRRGDSTDTMASYYLEQSKGTFTVAGDVAGWVRVPYPESWYGANDPDGSGDDLTGPTWRVARDAVAQLAADDPTFPWADYDNENPFGINPANGYAFNEPDGYVDHLILVHAGVDESGGGGAQGEDAIWAHSWWVYDDMSGGPGGNPGYQVPGSDIWVGPYTINPEDGGIGVFCHEFGHDLGLPDEYDTTYTGEETSGFWTLMASGSWLGREWGIETKPSPMNVWDKYVLGFESPKTVARGKTATVALQPASTGAASKSGVIVPLPDAKHSVALSAPDGTKEWYSNFGDNLDNTLTTRAKVAVPAGNPTLTFSTWYEIEEDYDYGFVEWSADGTTWHFLQTTAGSPVQTVDLGGGTFGLTGDGTSVASAVYDLTPAAGTSVFLQFEYYTDGGVAMRGWEVGGVKVNTTPVPDASFAGDGWVSVDGTYKAASTRYYIAEYRGGGGFDEGSKDCYQWNYDYPSKVDWFGYNRGLHLIYRDTWWQDADVGSHPGRGGWQVVDARPVPDGVYLDGADRYWRTRIQMRDAAFGLHNTKAQLMYLVSKSDPSGTDYDLGWGEQIAPGKRAQPWFNDANTWWYAAAGDAGTKIPRLGVRMHVVSQTSTGLKVWIDNVK
jgi:immune inhibitor A